jgi:hypothetical protein
MTGKERLNAAIRGEEVDQIPVCFYELNGFDQDPDDTDAYNVYSDPSWRPLLRLAAEETCCMPRPGMRFLNQRETGFNSF